MQTPLQTLIVQVLRKHSICREGCAWTNRKIRHPDLEAAARPLASPRYSARVGSTIAYYGDAARVREGFAIALGLLGLSAGMVDGLTRNQPEEGE
jgi:hypothetical protein